MAGKIKEGDYENIRDLAIKQVDAGVVILDVNVGVPSLDEEAVLPEVAKIVSKTVDIPLCLDSANYTALTAALAVLSGKPLVNSVKGEGIMNYKFPQGPRRGFHHHVVIVFNEHLANSESPF